MIKLVVMPLTLLTAAWAVGLAFHLLPLPPEWHWWVMPWTCTVVFFIGGGILAGGTAIGLWLEDKFPQWE